MNINRVFGSDQEGLDYQNPFALIDPESGIKYTISRDHWFTQSSFYGRNGDGPHLNAFPIVIARLADLAQ